MKKALILLAVMLEAGFAHAQSYAALENYSLGWFIQYMENLTEMKDGNILTSTRLFNVDAQGYYTDDYGYCFLKLSRENASVMDSAFLPVSYANFHLLEPHPSGNGYLFACQEYDFDQECNYMKIRHIDEDLAIHEEVVEPYPDTVYGGMDKFLLEGEHFILLGSKQDGTHVLHRYGLDGTLLDRSVMPDSVCNYRESRDIIVWNDSPREYAFTGCIPGTQSQFAFFVLDSLLQHKETRVLEQGAQYPNVCFLHSADNRVENLDSSRYLLATGYEEGAVLSPDFKIGVQITMCEKGTHANLKTVYFPFHQASSGIVSATPCIADLMITKEGYVCLAYGDQTGINKFSVVMLDTDLNVLWQNYYLNLREYESMFCMKPLSDGGLGFVGHSVKRPIVFALFVNNDYDATGEQGIVIRPYAFWPNPVKDRLGLQFSPDVTPAQIELYDLQGRLLKTQRNSLQSIDMEGLPAGTYTMRVTMEDGKAFSDKVVKE